MAAEMVMAEMGLGLGPIGPMALAEMGFGLMALAEMGLGLNGYWPNWELDQVALDEMALDEMGLDEVGIPLLARDPYVSEVLGGTGTLG